MADQNVGTQPADTTPDVNADYTSKFDGVTDAVAGTLHDLGYGAAATAADIGTSIWNSLPFTPDVSTHDLLQNVSQDAMKVYDEHPDTIQAASLLGGALIPSTLAIKGMNMMRAGVKGMSWFSEASQVTKLSELGKLFEAGPQATTDYRNLRNSLYAQGIANGVLDAAAAEAATVATFHDHPMMEDYMKDPWKNFGESMLLGGVLGGGLNTILTKTAIRNEVAPIAEKAFGDVLDQIKVAPEGLPSVAKARMHDMNANALTDLINNEDTSPFTRQVADKMRTQELSNKVLAFNEAIPETGKNLLDQAPEDVKKAFQDTMLQDPRFMGVDKLDFMFLNNSDRPGFLKKIGSLNDDINILARNQDTGAMKAGTSVYLPEFDKFANMSDVSNYLRAKDFGINTGNIPVGIRNRHYTPNNDFDLEIASARAADVDLRYLSDLKYFSSLDANDLKLAAVSPTDLSALNGYSALASKLGDDAKNLEVTVTKELPSYEGQVQRIQEGKAGVSPSHLDDIEHLAAANPRYNAWEDQTLSDTARGMLRDWVGGSRSSLARFRAAADRYFRKGSVAPQEDTDAFGEIYRSEKSQALRAELSHHADADGNVYLWRGLSRGVAVGHSPIESYTPSLKVAKTFGTTPKLYKVNVNDVVASITDTSGHLREAELLVGSPAREAHDALPVAGKITSSLESAPTIQSTKVKLSEIPGMLAEAKSNMIRQMADAGIPAENIAIKTNTPFDTVQQYLALGKDADSILDSRITGGISEYTDPGKISDYLSPYRLDPQTGKMVSGRAIKLMANPNKLESTAAIMSKQTSQLDGLNLMQIDKELKYLWAGELSGSEYSKAITSYLQSMDAPLEAVRSRLSAFINENAGNKMFQSTDFFSRHMGAAGTVASIVGKDLTQLQNRMLDRILSPVTPAMKAVAEDPIHTAEFSIAYKVNAQIKGWRDFNPEDGKFYIKANKLDPDTGKTVQELTPWQVKTAQGMQDFVVQSQEVRDLLEAMRPAGQELYSLRQTINKIMGKAPINDTGYWLPPMDFRNKFVAYVWDKRNGSTQMLVGSTPDELETQINAYQSGIDQKNLKDHVEIISTKSDQKLWNIIRNRSDELHMEIADAGAFHSGASQQAIPNLTVSKMSDVAGGIQQYLQKNGRQLTEMLLSDIMGNLDSMSAVNTTFTKDQPVFGWLKDKFAAKDTARIMKNTILGNSNLNESSTWKKTNQVFDVGINYLHDKIQGAVDVATKGRFGKSQDLNYDKFAEELANRDMYNPFEVFDKAAAQKMYLSSMANGKGNMAPRLVATTNALVATAALKFMELAQPLVNILSMPIMTVSAVNHNYPRVFLGAEQTGVKFPMMSMVDGIRMMHSDQFAHLGKMWEDMGYFTPMVSEANEILRMSRSMEPGIVQQAENLLRSKAMTFFGGASDWGEQLTRRTTMYTGAALAKRMYPGLDDTGVTIFARDFMDRALGNYSAAQRPTMFQGTLGVGLGLFQTYMLTMAQNMYRHLELGDYKNLGKMMLMQQGIFGTSSLPGFDQLSQWVGQHFSDDHVDLTTGMFKALPTNEANLVLYGLPSSLGALVGADGPSLYSRGAITPQMPQLSLTQMAGYNMMTQAFQTVGKMADVVKGEAPLGQALGEALSMQSISRPIARMSEFFTGNSVNQKGQTIATPEEVYTASGIMSRILGTRPLQEAKVREAMHLNTFYQSQDYANRQDLVEQLKTAIRDDKLDGDRLSSIAEQYLRTGTPTGWRSAINTAVATSDVNGKDALVKKLKPNSPLNQMIDGLD